MLRLLKEALAIRLLDIALESVFDRFFGESRHYGGNPRTLDADSYVLAKDLYGERISESNHSLNFYLKHMLHRVVKEYLPGEGSFKTFLFQVVDVSAFCVNENYLNKYSKVDKKYQNASNKEEADRYREQLKQMRKHMMEDQPVFMRKQKRMEMDGEIRDAVTVTFTIQKGILEFDYREAVEDGVYFKHGAYRLKAIGQLGHAYIDIPMVKLPTPGGQKNHLHKIIENKVDHSLYHFGAPIEIELVLSSTPTTMATVHDNSETEVEVNA